MKVMISNDKTRLIAKIDYDNLERTQLTSAGNAADGMIQVLNPSGLDVDDFLVVGNPGEDVSEITQISTITSNTVSINPSLRFAHENRSRVYKLEYDQIQFYSGPQLQSTNRYDANTYGDSNYTAIGSPVNVRADYYTSLSTTVEESLSYCMEFVCSETGAVSPKGDKINGYEYLLCSPADLRKYEDLSAVGSKVIDKIDVATWEIINKFQIQGQDYKDLSNRDVLRGPCALLALYYIFTELIKTTDDYATIKASKYLKMYKDSIESIAQYINKTETKVSYQGQTICAR